VILIAVLILATVDLAVFEKNVTTYTLPNGLKFIIYERHDAPVVSFHIHVKAGAVNEELGTTGIAHLLEHLAFRGTKKIGTKNWKKERKILTQLDDVREEIIMAKHEGDTAKLRKLISRFNLLDSIAQIYEETEELSRIYEEMGGRGINAYTSYDMTCYMVSLPSNKIELWAYLESDRLANPILRGFYRELEVVKEERRMDENSPVDRLNEELDGITFKVHPYGRPIIGYMEDLEDMTRRKVLEFYHKYYVPENMVIAIVGDVYPEELIPILKKYFSKLPKRKPETKNIPKEPKQWGERRVIIEMPAQPLLMINYHIPNCKHKDVVALDVLAEILGKGRFSRLYRRLVEEEKVATRVLAWAWTPKYPGVFTIYAVPARGHTAYEVEKIIYDEIDKLIKEGIKSYELVRAKSRIKVNELLRLDDNEELAEELAWYEAVTGDWRNLFKYLENIDKVAETFVKSVVEKYLVRNNRSVGIIELKL